MNNVLVIGANGFLGTQLSIELAKHDYNVLALVDCRFPYDTLKSYKNIITKEFQLENLDSIKEDEIFKNIDTIYHLAWVGVNANLRNLPEVQIPNISYGMKVMELAHYHHIKRVIIPGSAAEVSCGENLISGSEISTPADIYSAAKVASRYLCQVYARQHNIELIWMLVTSIYGPGRNDNNLISYSIQKFLKGEKPLTTKLEQKWDYLYIDDLIKAFRLIGEFGKGDKVYPVASGEVRTLREYIEIIRDLINPSLSVGIGEIPYKNQNKIDNQVFDLTSLIADTGFMPDYNFVDGIKEVINYFKTL